MYPPSPTVIYSFFFFNSSGLVNWEVGSQAAGATAAEKMGPEDRGMWDRQMGQDEEGGLTRIP